MKLKLQDLWRWDGEISRAPFLLWAGILFAIKYNFDRLLLGVVFGREWSVFSYIEKPLPWPEGLTPAQNPQEFAALLAVSVPFLWAGVVLCFKRLRSARLPPWFAVLFVVPILKWFVFVTLAIVPERKRHPVEPSTEVEPQTPPNWLPKSRFGSAALAVGASVLLATIATGLGTFVLHEYGWALFAGVPFCMGFLAAVIHSAHEPRNFGSSLAVAMIAVLLTGVALLVLAFEGLICILMAAPLAAILAALGALVGHAVQAGRGRHTPSRLYCIPLLAVPLMLGTESFRPSPPPLLKVVTAIEVDATPEVVWRHVVTFAKLPPPDEAIFKLGIAYPICAEINGRGPGAVRHCVFSTGPFVEPIEVWDEPQLLRFSVTENPEPMQEWTPYREIHPPHLNGFLVSKQGQFQLTPLSNGHTRLEGTTWYHHTLWPAVYWQLWSDHIIHTIHLRVLKHIKTIAEGDKP